MQGLLTSVGANTTLAWMDTIMTIPKSLMAAALLSTIAAASFAQTPAAPKPATAASAPAAVASKTMHQKKLHKAHTKSSKGSAQAASGATK